MSKKDIEHPEITNTLKTGYPNLDVVAQPLHYGTDFFGNEVLIGDEIIIDPETAEMFPADRLEDYLIEAKNFIFRTAK